MKRGMQRQASMDMFIVRSPKKSPAPSPTKDRGGMRQATLESLRGVVVVEDMERAVVVLGRKDVSPELKVDTLQHLLTKTPAKEVLIRTGLGKMVHKLCRSKDAEVAAVAQKVYRAWKKHIMSKMNRPYIEVKSDLRTQRLRGSAKQMLTDALGREEGGGGGGGGDNKEKRKSNEADQKRSESVTEVLKKGRDRDPQEKKEKEEKKEENEEESRGATQKRKRHEEAEEESKDKHRRKDGEKSEKQKNKDEEGEGKGGGGGGGGAKNSKRQEKEKGRKDRETDASDNPEENASAKHDPMEVLAEHIEREVYHSCQRRVDNSYRRTVRTLVFTLRHQAEVRKTVTSSSLSVPDFVKEYKKS